MNENYLNLYNNLINFTRNKELYKSLHREDSFSEKKKNVIKIMLADQQNYLLYLKIYTNLYF